jgi:hypothetical protein
MLLVMVGFAGFAVDLGYWYLSASRLQNAADASALGGVVFLPSDLGQATTVARQMVVGNGYPASGVDVGVGERPNQLRVTVRAEVRSFFLGVFGIQSIDLSRSALAEFEGPVPMGSPEAYLGNDPELNRKPDLWMNVGSLRNTPDNGDRFHNGRCGGNATCLTSTPANREYSGNGYFLAVKVEQPPAGQDLYIEVFDPAFYEVGDTCTADTTAVWGSPSSATTNANNLRTATATRTAEVPTGWYADAEARFLGGAGKWCAGDYRAGATTGGGGPITTTYVVRAPDDTPWLDTDNPVLSTADCKPTQFRGYDRTWMAAQTLWQRLTPNSDPNGEWRVTFPTGSWRQTFANSFRRWVTLCRVPAAQVQTGTYLLQVRTNAPLGSPLATDNTVDTWGHNRYSVRAGFRSGSGSLGSSGVRLFANGRLPIYVNADSAATRFYLARVTPGTVNRVLNLTLWDISDGGSAGSMRIRPPAEATLNGSPMTSFSGCTFTKSGGTWTTNASSCQISFAANALNANLVTISIPIPSGYACNDDDFGGCWVTVEAPFSGSVNDTTTWSADIVGDPVRLIE